MNTEKMREEFEAWFKTTHAWPCEVKPLEVSGDSYKWSPARNEWLAWQASRAALTIKLPEPMKGPDIDDENDDYEQFEMHEAVVGEVNSMLSKCRKAIESLGLKVKP